MKCDNCNVELTDNVIVAGTWKFLEGMRRVDNNFCSPECVKEFCFHGKKWFTRREFVTLKPNLNTP